MKFLLLTAFSLVTLSLVGQNLSFDQVQNLRKKNLAEVEEFLTTKGWSMTSATEASGEIMGKASFGYKLDKFDSEMAVAWVTFYESDVSQEYNRLSIQLHNSNIYTTFLTRLSANGYKLKSSKIIDGGINKIYSNSTTTCLVTTSTTDGTFSKTTTYKFFFIDNLSFSLNKEGE